LTGKYCALYDTKEFMYMPDEVYEEYAVFYSSRPLSDGQNSSLTIDMETIDEIISWIEDNLTQGSNKMLAAAFVSLAAATAVSI
jgi:hypothetical protein